MVNPVEARCASGPRRLRSQALGGRNRRRAVWAGWRSMGTVAASTAAGPLGGATITVTMGGVTRAVAQHAQRQPSSQGAPGSVSSWHGVPSACMLTAPSLADSTNQANPRRGAVTSTSRAQTSKMWIRRDMNLVSSGAVDRRAGNVAHGSMLVKTSFTRALAKKRKVPPRNRSATGPGSPLRALGGAPQPRPKLRGTRG